MQKKRLIYDLGSYSPTPHTRKKYIQQDNTYINTNQTAEERLRQELGQDRT